MRLARSVVALTIVLATTTSYMTRTSYAEDTAYAEVTTTTAVTAKYVPTTNTDKDLALGEFSESFKGAAKAFITPPAPKPVVQVSYAQTTGSSSGNTYAYGYCTWYVKSRISSLPNQLGNAYEWADNAQARGYNTGSVPAVGAVGAQGNHVVYVEWVSADKKSVVVSEMNYNGNLGKKTQRSAAASSFYYIYA